MEVVESVRTKQKRDTHSRLIQVAYEQFSELGIGVATTMGIARAAGVSHGTVFAHFTTRETLIVTVIETYGGQVVERMHAVSRRGAGLQAILEEHIAALADYEIFYFRLLAESVFLPREARLVLLGIQSAASFHIAEAAENAMREGDIRQMPAHLLFNTWIGLVNHYVANREMFAPGESVLRARGPELLGHFMSLIRPDSK